MSYATAVRNLRVGVALAEKYHAVHGRFLEDEVTAAEKDFDHAEHLRGKIQRLADWHAKETVNKLLPSDAYQAGQPEVAKNHAQIAQKLFTSAAWMQDHITLLLRNQEKP